MRIILLCAAALCVAGSTTPASAQYPHVERHSYTFIDNRLDVVVAAEAAGVLQVVRGDRGVVEVTSRSRDGLTGAGLGGRLTPELRLTAAGAGDVMYIVVVPEHVTVSVQLPERGRATVSPSAAVSTYRWNAAAQVAAPRADAAPVPAADALIAAAAAPAETLDGLFLVHASTWAPGVVDVPDLSAVRSLSVRLEGGDFRVAASRPLSVNPGSSAELELRVSGQPLDLVLYVPREGPPFSLRSGSLSLAEATSGRARALCDNVVVQSPGPQQSWLTFRPQGGRLACR